MVGPEWSSTIPVRHRTLSSDVVEILREMRDFRDLLWSLVRRDLVLRYRQTTLGIGWALFAPGLYTLVFTIIFTRVAPVRTGVPYPVFAYVGLLPWSFTASALRLATVSLTSNTGLLNKMRFPREVLPLSSVLVSFADMMVGSSLLAVLMLVYGIPVHWTIALVPVILLVQTAFTAGLAMLLAMTNLFFRDLRHVVDVGITVWMFATSVVYPLDQLGGVIGQVFALNPMTPILGAYRSTLLSGTPPPARPFATAIVIALTVLVVGWVMFHRRELRFAEHI